MLTLPSHYGKSVVFPCVRLRIVALATTRAIHIFNVELLYSRNRLFDSVRRISNGKPFLPPVIMGGMFCLRSGSDHSALLTQAGQGAEEIAAPKGAEAPTPDGRSSRAGAGQRKSEGPLPRGREEANGTPRVSILSVRDGCPNAGLGVVGGKGLRKPLPPAASRAGYPARTPGNIRNPAKKELLYTAGTFLRTAIRPPAAKTPQCQTAVTLRRQKNAPGPKIWNFRRKPLKKKSPCLIVTDRENVDRRREDMGGGGPSPQDKTR